MLTRAGSRAGRLLQQVHLPSTTSASASPFYFLRHCIRAISSSPVLAHTQEKECWSCGSCINEWKVFCGSCDSIQPPQDADYFGVFEMRPSFEVDVNKLDAKFKKLQMNVHPDRYQLKSSTELDWAEEQSALLNRAYTTLRNPCMRAQYLLKKLSGQDPLAEESRAQPEPQLLMEIMELREEIMEGDEDNLEELLETVERRIAEKLMAVKLAFDDGDYKAASAGVIALQYYTKCKDEIEDRTYHKESNQ